MLLTVYKSKTDRKSVEVANDADLTDFRDWAKDMGVYFVISCSEPIKNSNTINGLEG